MKWPLFENKIKDELSSHRSEVDIDALWSAIEPEVDALNQSKRKRRFIIFWFLLAGAVMLGGGIGGYYFLSNDKTTEKTIIADNNSEEKTIEEKHDQNLNTDKATNDIQEGNEETAEIIDNQLAVNTAKNSLINNNNLKNDKNQTIEKNKSNTPENIDSKNLKNNEKIIANNDSHFEISEIQDNNKTTVKSISETIPKEKTAYLIPTKKLGTLAIPLFKIQTTPQLDIQDLKNELAEDATTPTPPDENRHPMDKKDFRFAIGVYGGISYANRNLSATDNTANDLLKLRESSEKQLETTQAGLQFSMRHRSGFDLATGLQYTRMVERFNYNQNITELDSIDGVLYYAVNPNNDTLAIMGMVPHTTITDIRKEYYNKYTMVEIPVLVGYFKEKDDWSFGAQAGVFANISLKTEGQFLSSATTSTDIKDLFKSNVGLSYYVGASINHKLNKNIEIGISPYLRQFPKNFAKTDYGISQKYTLFGINARINYWF